MFWTILLGITILVVGFAGVIGLLEISMDAWEVITSIVCFVLIIVWVAVFICIGIWYAHGPFEHTFPPDPRSEVEITGTS